MKRVVFHRNFEKHYVNIADEIGDGLADRSINPRDFIIPLVDSVHGVEIKRWFVLYPEDLRKERNPDSKASFL